MFKQQKSANPTGESHKQALRVSFDARLKLEFHGSKITSDAGLLAYRELERLCDLRRTVSDEMANQILDRHPRNPVGSAFYYWDGSRANGEGYLPENWHAYAGIFAGHYGIRFDKNGYSLEPWSPLKGKKLPCNMPVMGKIQQTMK